MRYDHQFRETGFHSALLSTFSFDPIGFENVLLTTLKSAGCRNIAVIGDRQMINQAAADIGVPSFAGQSYHLAKRDLKGCFHPKISLQFGRSKGRILIGSSNLTTAGMIGNLEAFSYIEYSEENPDSVGIFASVLNYFERHSNPADLGMKRSIEQVRRLTPWLRGVEANNFVEEQNGARIGVFTDTEDASIADQLLAEISGESITELLVVSPFWDTDLRGLQALRHELGNPNTIIIPDLNEQDFSKERALSMKGVSLRSPSPLGVSERRRLHAKVIILKGQEHDYALTGSMNASQAGLWGRGEYGGNSEAAIFRKIPDPSEIGDLVKNLDICLQTPFPDECFQMRERQSAEGGQIQDEYRDGGQLQVKNGQIRWIAPAQSDDAEIIILKDEAGEIIDGIEAKSDHPIRLSNDVVTVLHSGCVRFSDGLLSAPISIAILSQLERAMEPPQSLRHMRIIDELKSKRDIRDIFEMLGRVEALHHESMQSKRKKATPVSKNPSGGATDEPSRILTEEEFYSFEDDENTLEVLGQTSTLSELRHSINRIVGHYHTMMIDPNSRLSEFDTNVASDEEMAEWEGNPNATMDDGSLSGCEPDIKPADIVLKSTTARREALEFMSDILHREEQLRSIISLQEPGELDMDHALLFQVIVLTTLAVSSTDKPTTKYPLSPLSQDNGGWIRILARFLLPHCKAWKHHKLLNADHDEYQIEALGMLSASVQLLLEALPKYDVPKIIVSAFEPPALTFLAAAGKMSKSNASVGDMMDTIVLQIMSSKDALRLTNPNSKS